MTFDYYTLLCPTPIRLPTCTIKKHTLREIGEMTFKKYMEYEAFALLSVDGYFKHVANDEQKSYWELLPEDQKETISLYDLITLDQGLAAVYLQLFNEFIIEDVVFDGRSFYVLNDGYNPDGYSNGELKDEDIKGVINHTNISSILDVIQQVCCIKSDNPLDEPDPVFKNERARQIYEKMKKAEEEQKKKEEKENNINMSLPNLISSTASKSPGLNMVDVWDLTVFQLYDQFNKTQESEIYYINCVRVAVWGDEKNTFDATAWYKNKYDKQ